MWLQPATSFIRSGYRLEDAESQEIDRYGNAKYFVNNLVGIFERGQLVGFEILLRCGSALPYGPAAPLPIRKPAPGSIPQRAHRSSCC